MGKQVKTPRFYVDIPTFLHATGRLDWDSDKGGAELLYMYPSNPYLSPTDEQVMFKIGETYTDIGQLTSFPINFIALLNHNLASDNNYFMVQGTRQLFEENDNEGYDWETLTGTAAYNCTSILNAERGHSNNLNPSYNGSSIFSINDGNGNPINDLWSSFFVKFNDGHDDYVHQLGSLVVGKYWDAPNSPDLSLTMSRRFDGIKKQKTIGGKTLANIYYDGPTEWTMNRTETDIYKYPPFEFDLPSDIASVGDFNARAKSGLGRKGLRSWNLTFSYISEDDMWMDYESSNILISSTASSGLSNPMLEDDSFNFVWNCTLGGTLPFIFTDDKDSDEPDRYAICTFRSNTLSVKQVAFNTYSLSITIDEVA